MWCGSIIFYILCQLQQLFQEKQEIQVQKCVNNGKWSHQGVWMSGSDKLAEIFHSTQSGTGIMGHHDVIAPTIYCRWERRLWKTLKKATNGNQMLQMFHRLLERPPTLINRWVTIRPYWQKHDIILSVDKAAWVRQKIKCVYIHIVSYLFQRKYWFTGQSCWILISFVSYLVWTRNS